MIIPEILSYRYKISKFDEASGICVTWVAKRLEVSLFFGCLVFQYLHRVMGIPKQNFCY